MARTLHRLVSSALLLGLGLGPVACAPMSVPVNLKHGSDIRGVAGLTNVDNPGDNRMHQVAVQISLFNSFAPGDRFDPVLRTGTCASRGEVVFPLETIVVGNAPSNGVQGGTLIDTVLEQLRSTGVSLEIIQSGATGAWACGEIP